MPVCKSTTKPENDGYLETEKGSYKYSDKTCIFNDSIPVVMEEEVFARKPGLILATVDNFAKVL